MQSALPIAQTTPTERPCPTCQTLIPVHPQYVVWCDKCGWNMQPQASDPSRNRFEALFLALGRHSNDRLRDDLLKAQTLRPRWTISKIVTLAIAAAIHSLGIIFVILAVLQIGSWPSPIAIIGSLFCAGMAWGARPRMERWPREVIDPKLAPTLYRITDEISRALSTSNVDGIVLNGEFNAAFTQVGLRRRKLMYIGLPLFAALDQQEKLALLAHEVAHGVNGDPLRGVFVGSAMDSLIAWYDLLHPRTIWPEGSGAEGLLMIPLNLLLLGLAQVVWLIYYILIHLNFRTKQHAEYLADALAARVSGSQAAVSAFSKFHLDKTFELTLQRARYKPDEDLFNALRQEIAQVPQREIERVRRVEHLENARLDVTHPPTLYRVQMLQAHPVAAPAVTITPAEWEALEQELVPARQQVQKALLRG